MNCSQTNSTQPYQPLSCKVLLIFLLCIGSPQPNLHAQDSRGTVDSLTAIAEHQFAVGEFGSAREHFEAALDFDKKDLSALIGLGKTYFAEKEWRSARDEFEKLLTISPIDLEAHYYAAICYREMGKTKGGALRADDWKRARKHFQAVTAADSSFGDVLQQLSILEEYDKEFEAALELAHAELRLRKDLAEPQMRIFKLYRHFTFDADSEKALAWLRLHPSRYARYFIGEVFRAANKPDDAARAFEEMLQSDSAFPRQALLLSLVKINVQRGNVLKAEQLYWQAVDSIDSPLGADLVFDDITYIMNDDELRLYRTLQTLERKRAFFRAFWSLRNPLAGSHTNARLIEHYRRMVYAEENFSYYGFRIWFNNPDKTKVLHFPQSYSLNYRFNDKGLIYLRHGPPNEIERAAGLGPERADPNESWLYHATPESPKWIFNFVSIVGNWRLAPLPTDSRMYDALSPWDARYGRLSSKILFDRLNDSETLTDVARENVSVALSTDEHSWKRDVQQFRIVTSVDAFRSDGGRSLLDISYAIPMPVIARLLPTSVSQVSCEVGISITNLTTRAIANKLDTISFPISRSFSGFITNLIRYVVKPDSYAIALHVHPLGVEAFGRWRTRTRVQDFSSRDFLQSDLQFLMPSSSSASIEIDGMKVIQVPFTMYRHGNPMYVYCQVYNLADNNGQTSLTTEYFLTPSDDTRGERRILLKKSAREGKEESSGEFAALNIDSIQPGKYILSVRVTDHYRNRSSERSRHIEVAEN